MKSISLIGSTGSIGMQTCSVVRRHGDRFRIAAMAANSSAELFLRQVEEFRPEYAALADEKAAESIRDRIPSGVRFAGGKQAAFQIIHFLQEHLRLEIRGENPDKTLLLEPEIARRHVRQIVILLRQFQHKLPLLRYNIRLIFQNPADRPDGQARQFRQFFQCDLRHFSFRLFQACNIKSV